MDINSKQKFHQLGRIPSYLRNKRPLSATSKLRSNGQEIRTAQKDANNEEKSNVTKSAFDFPKYEQRGLEAGGAKEPKASSKNESEATILHDTFVFGKDDEYDQLCEKIKQLQEKCDQQEAECEAKQKRITKLEVELAVKCDLIEKVSE